MAEVPMALMTVEIPGGKPGIARAAEALGVSADAIDRGFGVVSVDPSRHLYAVQVREDALPRRAKKSKSNSFSGPFANPRIEPFGPTRR
jgi:hypothetical protein